MQNSVRSLAQNEYKIIGKIIADGFADDPVNLWAFCSTKPMQPVFTTMAKHLYLPAGYGFKSADNKAGALWLPPEAKKYFSLLANIKMAAAILSGGGINAVKNSLHIDAFLQTKKPEIPIHYLFAIAVHPSLQGRGIGGMLMKEALLRVDATRRPAYLESSKYENVPFYQRHGFEIMEKVSPGKGCSPMWLMWREGR